MSGDSIREEGTGKGFGVFPQKCYFVRYALIKIQYFAEPVVSL